MLLKLKCQKVTCGLGATRQPKRGFFLFSRALSSLSLMQYCSLMSCTEYRGVPGDGREWMRSKNRKTFFETFLMGLIRSLDYHVN